MNNSDKTYIAFLVFIILMLIIASAVEIGKEREKTHQLELQVKLTKLQKEIAKEAF